MSYSQSELDQLVRKRAHDRCEYCGMHQSLQGATFHIEHITPRSKGGLTIADNLALSCPGCNLKKSDKLEAIDPETGSANQLFSPRIQSWTSHFRWEAHLLVGTTPIGRATVSALDLNHRRRQKIRQAEQRFGLFPPDRHSE